MSEIIKKKNISKFSNISVFERREQNKLYIKNLKKYIPLKLNNLKRKEMQEREIKKKNSEINDIIYSFYIYQTSEGNKTKNSLLTDKSNITFESLFNKTANNCKNSPFPFYLTETQPCTIYNKNNLKNKRSFTNNCLRLSKNISKDNKIHNLSNNEIFTNKYKTFSRLSDFFQEKKEELKKENNKTYDLIEMKRNKLRAATQDNFYNAKQYIDKTRKLMLLKYNSLIDHEVKSRIEEKIENSNQLLNNKIYSLNKLKDFQNHIFDDKLTEYARFIIIKKDNEEKYDLNLLNQIYSLKSQISALTNKIKKIQIEKNNIIQWILLQIKVKERKMNLPYYYTKLLEINIPKAEKQRRMGKIDILKTSKPKYKKSKSIQITKEKIKMINKDSENFLSEIPEEEVNKILFYRQNLIFKTPDDFLDEIKSIENKNLNLFDKVDTLLYDIKRLKEKYNNLINDKDFCNSSLILKIKKNEIELEDNKQIFTERKNLLTEYLNNNNKRYNSERKNKNSIFINFEINDNEIGLNSKKPKLFFYVEKLFLTCEQLKIKKDSFNQITKKNTINNRSNEKTSLIILNMLKFIEIRISKILTEFLMYKNPQNPNYDYVKKLRINFNKKRNIEKAHLVKLDKERMNLKLFKELQAKNVQVLFLKKNKKDLHNHLDMLNEQIKKKKRKIIKISIPKIEDFLFHDIIDNNKETKINNE